MCNTELKKKKRKKNTIKQCCENQDDGTEVTVKVSAVDRYMIYRMILDKILIEQNNMPSVIEVF